MLCRGASALNLGTSFPNSADRRSLLRRRQRNGLRCSAKGATREGKKLWQETMVGGSGNGRQAEGLGRQTEGERHKRSDRDVTQVQLSRAYSWGRRTQAHPVAARLSAFRSAARDGQASGGRGTKSLGGFPERRRQPQGCTKSFTLQGTSSELWKTPVFEDRDGKGRTRKKGNRRRFMAMARKLDSTRNVAGFAGSAGLPAARGGRKETVGKGRWAGGKGRGGKDVGRMLRTADSRPG